MTQYQDFVKQQMAKLRGVDMPPQMKMQHIGEMWRASGMASTGRKVARGAVRGAVRGAKKAYKGGSMMSLHGGGIQLDNGTPLHPEMMGSGFWKKLGKDTKKAFSKETWRPAQIRRDMRSGQFGKDFVRGMVSVPRGIGEAAQTPEGKAALAVAPFLL